MRNLEGWLQAITPMLIAVIAFSFYLGRQGSEMDSIKKQLTEIKIDMALDKQVIAKTIVPSINGNRFAIVFLCRDMEVFSEITDCSTIFPTGI